MDLSTVLGSGVVAGLVAGLVTLITTERKIAIENITQQRQIWREKVREKAIDVIQAYEKKDKSRLNELYVEFQLILNPENNNDKSILDSLWAMLSEEENKKLPVELSEKLALLLKHDWERAKKEAKFVFVPFRKPKRIAYSEFNKKRHKQNS